MPQHDFECADVGGTIAFITPRSDAAVDWIGANVVDATLVGGCYLEGEPRFMLDVALGMIADGLTCPNSDKVEA